MTGPRNMGKDDRDATNAPMMEELQALRAEVAALRERCAISEAVIEAVPDAVFVKDLRGRYVMINTAGARLLGKPATELLGKEDPDLFSPDSARRFAQDDRTIIAEGTARTYEETAATAEVTRTCLTTKVPYVDGRGRIAGIIGIARDVTEGKRLQADRDRLLDRLRLQIDRLPLACILIDANALVCEWNPAAVRVFGYSKDEAVGRNCLDLIAPLPLDNALSEILRRVWAGDMNAHSVNENRTKSGKRIYCEWVNTPLVEEDGTFVGVVSLAQDITERKKTEEALEASRRRFQAVFEYSLDGILLMDDEGRYVDGNPAICELLGCSHDALVKMSVWDVTPLPDRERIPELLDAFRSAGTLSGEYTLLCKGGATRDVEYRSVANIQPGLHLGVHRDITDRKRSAAALRESEERFRFLAESIPHMVWAVSPDGNVDYYNRRLLEYLGVTTEQVQGQRWAETVHPDDRRRALEAWEHAFHTGAEYRIEYRLRNGRTGEFRWFIGHALPQRDPAGKVVYWCGTCTDIDERVRMEEELRGLNAALENAVEGIAQLDTQGRYVSVNPAYAGMLGHSAWELIGRDWQTTVCPQDLEKVREAYRRMLEEGRAELEVLGIRQDRSVFWKQVVMVKAHDKQRIWMGHYCFMKDITERKQAEEALRDYAERSQVLSRRLLEVQEAERRHLARELHDEVGQLLTGLRLLLNPQTDRSAVEYRSKAVQARDLVDELLERIRSMSFDLRPAALDELGLLPALLALLESYTQRTGVVVNFRHQGLEGRFEPEVESAAYRIVQEALTNVARHAGVGDVTVRAWSSADTLGLRVEDRGRGFDPKVTSVTSKSAGLSGMRERVLLLDGRLAIESGPSMGTQITAELPIGGGREGASDANLDRARG